MTCLGAIVEAEDCEIDKQTGCPNGGDPSCLKACMTPALPQAVRAGKGKGKGFLSHWVCRVRPGQVLNQASQ